MWLINANSLILEEHRAPDREDDRIERTRRGLPERKKTPYSILSHRWENDEVTFQQFQYLSLRTDGRGFDKIKRCCKQSLRDRIKHVWIDTCCINKDSLAELSESINSMFTWYQEAQICYVYLSDCDAGDWHTFRNSVWFTRGWTLQELVASTNVKFFDRSWRVLGTKTSLVDRLIESTPIPRSLCQGLGDVKHFSIAQRMSWAAGRDTERPEDRAYSMLGIFGVNMPMLYGEGGLRAFRRLQDEIVKTTYDHSLFAWSRISQPNTRSVLPSSADDFENMSGVVTARHQHLPLEGYTIGNRGLAITLQLWRWSVNMYLARLECRLSATNEYAHIFLLRAADGKTFVRTTDQGRDVIYENKDMSSAVPDITRNVIIAASSLQYQSIVPVRVGNGYSISHIPLGDRPIRLDHGVTHDRVRNVLVRSSKNVTMDFMASLEVVHSHLRYIRLGFDFEWNPVILLGGQSLAGPSSAAMNALSIESYLGWCAWSVVDFPDAWEVEGDKDLWAIKVDATTGIDTFLRTGERTMIARLRVFMTELDNVHWWAVSLE